MFFGTTPSIVSQYLYDEFQALNPKRIFVPFAGNFVIEQVANKACPKAEIHSTDVMIYSNAIGFGVTGKDFKLEIKPEFQDEFKYLAGKKEPLEKAAIVLFFTEVSKAVTKKKILYYKNIYEDAVINQKMYFRDIMMKLEKAQQYLSKIIYYGMDAVNVLKNVKKGDLVFYDPPIGDGNADYENQYKAMKEMIDFDEVEYTDITTSLKLNQLMELINKGAVVYWRTNNPIEPPDGFTEVFRYRYKWNGYYCIYANKYMKTFAGSFSPLKETAKNIPIIGIGDEIKRNSRIDFIPQTSAVGNHYRLMWIRKAQVSDSGRSYIILIDGKLIGMAQICSALKFGTDLAVIFSDPAAPTSRYKRLSKLILNLICTKETLADLDEHYLWEHKGFTTRVFTNNHVSMKYRGLFDLDKREMDNGSDYKYKLIY